MCRAPHSMAAALALVHLVWAGAGCSKKEPNSDPPPAESPPPVSAPTAPDPSATPAASPESAAELPATPVSPEPASQPPASQAQEPAGNDPSPPVDGKPDDKPSDKPADSRQAPPEKRDEPAREGGQLPAQGDRCDDGRCAAGLTCLDYYGIAGANGPRFTSCEIPCKGGKGCPEGQVCVTISDGPGQVCRPGT